MKDVGKQYMDKYYREVSYPGGKESYKESLLTLGGIEGLLHTIKHLRYIKDFKQADILRDKLVEIGYYWFQPQRMNLGNLSGSMQNKLEYIVHKDGEIELFGIVHLEDKRHCEIYYSTAQKRISSEDKILGYSWKDAGKSLINDV